MIASALTRTSGRISGIHAARRLGSAQTLRSICTCINANDHFYAVCAVQVPLQGLIA